MWQRAVRVLPLSARRTNGLPEFIRTTYTSSNKKVILTSKRGREVIQDPNLNKGTAFTVPERQQLGLTGLVPSRMHDISSQIDRVILAYRKCTNNLDRYSFLSGLKARNVVLYYKVLIENLKDFSRIIYTPTVGKACLEQHKIFRRPHGLYFTASNSEDYLTNVYNWPENDVDVIVVTDGSRILALGDLGANGINIPVGKLDLYVAGGGINPKNTVPCILDFGTDNAVLRENKMYNGLAIPRIRGDKFWHHLDLVMDAIRSRWPYALIQFEDFSSDVAAPMLRKYRNTSLVFNDDIQSTGVIALATVLASLRSRQLPDLLNERFVCVGAGSAGLGVCESLVLGMMQQGLTREEACTRFWIVDENGLLTADRTNLTDGQRQFARSDSSSGGNLESVISDVSPTILLGLSGKKGIFTKEILEKMAALNEKPVILPLSNPSSCSECTYDEALQYTDGRAIFASGSPFGEANQCNNAYSFPGIGLATSVFNIKRITDGMMLAAAERISLLVTEEDALKGRLLPGIENLREVSIAVAAVIVKQASEEGMLKSEDSIEEYLVENEKEMCNYLRKKMWEPEYPQIIAVN